MKTAVVIGAGRGIGLETVKAFLNLGYETYAVARNTASLDDLGNGALNIIKGDIDNESDRARIALEMKGKSIDCLVLTAGVLIKKDIQVITEEDFNKLYHTNVYSIFDCIRKLANQIKMGGHVITIGSMGGVSGGLKFPGMLFYSSSKAALATLTECLAVEYAEKQIHFNCLALGAVETEMKNSAFPDYKAPHTAEEMGQFIAMFSQIAGPFFNGKTLPVSISTP